ncbi:MAG: hypothetical protein ACRDZ9_08170 [Acidimicrobiales bacterium]
MAAVAATGAAGLALVGGVSLEAARRRAGLVGQIRFAVTLYDLRTVMLLRRQLAQERARGRPWLALPPGVGARFPVMARDWRGLLRFPAVRVARMGALGAVAGLAMRGVWSGTTPLLAVAAVVLFVVALDAIEPLSQDADRPYRWAPLPVRDGALLLRHLAAPVAAAASVVTGTPDATFRVQFPEAAGTSVVLRVVWPPGLIALALSPVVAARAAARRGLDPLPAASGLEPVVVVAVAVVLVWLSTRRARLQ